MPKNSWKYFVNKECEFFPCHKGADSDNFSCLQCYCPIYWHCGTRKGGLDCKDCMFPHDPKMHDSLMESIKNIHKREITNK